MAFLVKSMCNVYLCGVCRIHLIVFLTGCLTAFASSYQEPNTSPLYNPYPPRAAIHCSLALGGPAA